MTDTGPPTQVDDIVVQGQRRRPGGAFPEPFSGTGGGGNEGGGSPAIEDELDTGEGGPFTSGHPCASPETALEWNTDAAAAQTVKDLLQFARTEHPDEQDFYEREYGAVLWQMPDGSIVRGPMRAGEVTFYEAATSGDPETRGTVALDWTPPAPGALVIGTVHTHGAGSFLPSGSNRDSDDQGVLTYTQALRNFQSGATDSRARLYVAAREFGVGATPGPVRTTIYNEQNREAALGGTSGPDINPDGQPCM